MKSKITIKDIARELNIHHTTVSRALRNDLRISEKVRHNIVAYAREHGYEVNQNALNFRNNGRREIALIVPNISHYTFSYFISKFGELAQQHGFIVSVFQSQENVEIENQIIQTIIRNRVMGVVASISKTTHSGEQYAKIIDFGIPLVFFDRVCNDVETSKVMTDNLHATLDAVRYLFNKGYRRIAHITGPQHINVFHDRHQGLVAGLDEFNLSYRNTIVVDKEFELSDGASAFNTLMLSPERPDAVLCDSFLLSAGLMQQCKLKGVRIPEDLSVMAIANDPFSALIDPPQTVLEQPIDEIVASAFSLLLQYNDPKADHSPRQIYHSVKLIERKSV